MNKMSNTDFKRCLQTISTCWTVTAPKWNEETLAIWRVLLDDVDYRYASAAILAIAAKGEHFAPGPGEVRRQALELANPSPDPDQAWAEVHGFAARHGTRRWCGGGDWCLERYPEPPEPKCTPDCFACDRGMPPEARTHRRYNDPCRGHAPEWSHPAITDTVQNLGWHEICKGDPQYTRSAFLSAYKDARERWRFDTQMPAIVAATYTPSLGASIGYYLGLPPK